MRILILLLCIVFLPTDSYSSNTSTSEKLIRQANELRKAEKVNLALKLLKRAESLVEKETIQSENELFLLYRTYGYCYILKKEYGKALENFQKSELLLEQELLLEPIEKSYLWNGFGNLFSAKEDYEKSADYYLKSCEEIENTYLTEKALEDLYITNKVRVANCYVYAGQVVKAKEYFLSALKLFNENELLILQYTTHSNLGYCYDELGDYDDAIYHYEQCEPINEQLKVKETTAINNLGVIYLLIKKDIKKAKYYFEKVLEIIDRDPKAEKEMYSYAAENLVIIYSQEEDNLKATKYIDIALKSAIEVYGTDHIHTNDLLSKKGQILMRQGKIKKAEMLFKQANQTLSIDINDEDSYRKMPYRFQLYNVLMYQSAAYLDFYERTGNLEALKKSDHLSDVNIAMIHSARSTLSNADSKTALLKSAYAVFDVKVKSTKLLYEATQNPKYINTAFEIFEKTNNILLMEAILQDEIASRMGLSKELFDQQNSLKMKLANAESELYEKKKHSTNDTIGIASIEKKISDVKSIYRSFVDDLKKDYPNYYNYNYNDELVTIQQLQSNILGEDQTVIQYFVSEKEIFSIVISKEDVGFYSIPNKEDVIENVHKLRDGIYQAYKQKNVEAGLEDLQQASLDLYATLIKPIEIPLKEKLIIIPMGELSYIPFDVLLEEEPKHLADFYDYKFMLRNHAISYGYSSTLLNKFYSSKADLSASKGFLGFAPTFNSRKIASSRSELVSLEYNQSEVLSIKKMIGGEVFTGEDASRNKFVELCDQNKIIHLATHGVSNSKQGENSYLAFSRNEMNDENSLLYARDIYNLNLNADLVVLSACETAIGELQLAEGVISLARAFTYAGAKSNVTTLWQVNDGAASILMQNFYKELKQGIPKDEALRNAKLTYLTKSLNINAHPFFWSTFIVSGDMRPIEIADNLIGVSQYSLFGASAFLLFGIGMFLLYRNRLVK